MKRQRPVDVGLIPTSHVTHRQRIELSASDTQGVGTLSVGGALPLGHVSDEEDVESAAKQDVFATVGATHALIQSQYCRQKVFDILEWCFEQEKMWPDVRRDCLLDREHSWLDFLRSCGFGQTNVTVQDVELRVKMQGNATVHIGTWIIIDNIKNNLVAIMENDKNMTVLCTHKLLHWTPSQGIELSTVLKK